MKKSLLFATLVGVALTGCVNDEVATDAGTQKEMLFGVPALKTQTRANILGEINSTDAYAANGGESFCVTAWRYKGAYAAGMWSDASWANFFATGGEVATKAGTYWTTATTHYWPGAAYNLLFAAYSPANLNVTGSSIDVNPTITYNATGVTIQNFKVQPNADHQYDLMYSDYAYDLNVTQHGGSAVGLKFNHALSSIVFSVSKSQADVHYEITGVELLGDYVTSGTFKQNIGVTDGGNPVGVTWEYTDSNKETCEYKPTFSTFEVTEAPQQFTSGPSALLLIPQSVPDNAKVRLHYTKKVAGATDLIGETDILLKDFVVPVDASGNTTGASYKIENWKAGVRYIYRIAFGENKPIYFSPTVEEWLTEPTAVYTINY